MVPFVDLVTPHEELKEELLHVFQAVLQYGRFSGGPMVEQFETDPGLRVVVFNSADPDFFVARFDASSE